MVKSVPVLAFGGCLIVIQPFLIGRLHSQQAESDIVWKFDEAKGRLVHDSVSNKDDQIERQWRRMAGVEGGALEFDGPVIAVPTPLGRRVLVRDRERGVNDTPNLRASDRGKRTCSPTDCLAQPALGDRALDLWLIVPHSHAVVLVGPLRHSLVHQVDFHAVLQVPERALKHGSRDAALP